MLIINSGTSCESQCRGVQGCELLGLTWATLGNAEGGDTTWRREDRTKCDDMQGMKPKPCIVSLALKQIFLNWQGTVDERW